MGRPRPVRLVVHGIVAVLVATLAVVAPVQPASASTPSVVAPAAARVVPSSSNNALSDDFNVSGYAAGTTLLVNLAFSAGSPAGTTFSINTTTGLTRGFGYSGWTGLREISFTGVQADVNNALDSLTINAGTTQGTALLSVSVTTSDTNIFYYALTDNFYQAVSSSGVTWTSANTAASAATYKGRPGYLVTLTSPEEQSFLNNNVSINNIWIGLTDKDCEGTWKWQGGPEAGQTAFQATARTSSNCADTGSSYSSTGTSPLYANWCPNEPNNSDGTTGEDMAVAKWNSGTCWNDLRDGNSSGVGGYVVEYGDSQAFTDFYSSSMTIAVSNTPGTIASVTSDKLNGTYTRGEVIDIKVNFTDPVNVTGSPTLTLDATGNDNGAIATYVSGSGTSTLIFRYTVLEGHADSDLNYASTNAITLNGGSITLVSGGTNATLTLPATSAAESLGGSKNIVITAGTLNAPTSAITAASLAAYATSTTVSIPYTASDPSTTIRSVQAFYSTSVTLTSPTSCGTTTSATSPNTVTCTLPSTNTTYYLYTRATDAAGNVEAAPSSADDSVILDNTVPAVTFGGATSLALGASTSVTFTFGEAVTGFTASSLSATFGTLTGFSGSGASYSATFTASGTLGGTAVISVAAGAATDVAGNTNLAATRNITVATAPNSRTAYNSSGTNYIVERYTTVATGSWRAPRGVSAVDLLVVGGGGGAGSRGAGGGGAGGYVEANSYAVTAGSTYNVTVGAGGAGVAASTSGSGAAGSASSFLLSGVGLTANGGGGGNGHGSNTASGGNSGSGSGAGGTAYQNNGALGRESNTCGSSDWCGGGGGGAGAVGEAASSGGGNGGAGRASSITGSSVIYAGGGGGGGGSSGVPSSTPSPAGSGGSGGGGAGGTPTWNGSTCLPADGTNGTNGLGGGGGGGGYCDNTTATFGQGTGGSGGSGIVVLRYALPSAGVPDLEDASDLGSSPSDDRTSDTTPTFSGGAPVGSSVQLFANGSSTGGACPTDNTTGIWQCTTAALTAGTYNITAMSTTTLETGTVTSTSSALSVTIDTTAPTITSFSSSTADGSYGVGQIINVTATASEAVLSGSSFVATLNITPSRTVTLTAASQGTTLTGSYTVQATDTSADLTVSSFTTGTVTDLSGNTMTTNNVPTGASNIAGASAIVIDTTGPTFSSAAVNAAGTQITLTYNETLGTTAPLATAFAVTNVGYTNPVTGVSISGSTVVLTLTETIYTGQAVTLAYTDPTAGNDANAIQDLAGNDAASRTSAPITNGSTATIPRAARLIGLQTETVVSVSGSGVTGGVRGITSDGTNIYFRLSSDYTKIFSVAISSISAPTGANPSNSTATATSWSILDSNGNTVSSPAYEATQLAYSSGCIFLVDSSNVLKCIDISTRRMSDVSVPAAKPLVTGQVWLVGDLVSFPDGRIGKISAQTLSGGSYNSTLRLYNVSGSGSGVSLTWSEDMILRDTENFPGDDHGFATDGVYGYRLKHLGGYKVWRLQSDPAVSNIIFNGDGTGTCGGSGTQCSITPTGIGNTTYMGYDLSSNRYIVGDWSGTKFYMTESANPGVGPGTAPVTVSSFSSAVTSPTTSPSPSYTLTFNTAVTGVTSADFTNTGSATCTFAVSAVSTSVYTVTPTCGDGTVRPQFAANGAILASNGTSTGPAFAAAASTTITVGIPPTVIAFTSTTADGSYRATQTINITATMSEAIRSGNSFVVTLNTGATVTLNAAAAGTTLTGTYTVGASQTTSDLTVSSYTVGTVLDTAGNAMTSTTLPAGANIADTSDIAIDTTAPSVVSFTSAQSSPTNATSFTYTITFSEAVTGVAAGDFSNTGTAGPCSFDPGADTSSTMRTVTVSGCGSGTVTPRFSINGASDGAGNTGPSSASTSGTTITRDTTAPTIASFSSTTADGSYTTGQNVNITATADEALRSGSSITVTLDTGATVVLNAASAGTTMTGTYTIVAGQNSADLNVTSYTYSAGAVLDTAGNAMTSTSVPTGASNIAGAEAIVIDTTGPAAPTGLSATATQNSVTISFTPGIGGPSAVTNYKYSLNGGAFTAFSPADTSSPVTISGLTTGTGYTIALRTVTAIGDSASSATVTITPSNITGLTTVSYTEQAAATSVASSVNFSGGTSYDGKYIDFAIGSPQATEILGYTTSGSASTTNGAVSIVGTSVYLGNGTSADPIGSIDSTRNGQNGQPLRINFVSSFSNNSFETGDLSGWTYLDQQINLGVTSIAGFVTSDTSTYPNNCASGASANDHAVTNVAATAFNYEVITSSVGGNPGTTDGTKALRLFSSTSASPGGYIIHGPAVYSEVFSASAGDNIYFDWRAAYGGDNYHVFGYIVNVATGVQTELLDATGPGTTNWTTKATSIPTSGNYRFVFVSGTHDANCATGGGASLYIDNVLVFGSKVNDSVATKVAQLVTYRNTSDAPSTSRTVTVTTNPTGGTFTTTFNIAVTAVDDAPALTSVSTSYTNTSATDTFTAASGTLPGSDPDGDTLTYSLPDGTSATATYGSITYDRSETGTYGTLWVRSSTGQYYFAPDNTAINNRLTNDSESFSTRLTAAGVSVDSTLTVSIVITAAAPGAPTGLTVTPGVRALNVSWTAPTWIGGAGVTGYRIEYSTNGTSWTTASDNTSTATSLRIASLSDATAYHVRVAAKNTNGTGSYVTSSPTTFSTFDKPTALTLTPVGGTVVANTLNSTNTNLTAQATIVAGRLTGGTATLYRGSTGIATDTSIGASDTTVNFDLGASTTSELQALIASTGTMTVKVVDANGLETLASTGVTLTVDYVRPTISIARSGSGVLNRNASDTITFTLSEASTNFTSGVVTTSGGTLSTLSGSGSSYTSTFTVASNAVGTATINVLGSAFTDAAGNGNTASSTLSISLNSAPTLATPSTAAFTDTIAADIFANATGTLVGADTDSGDTLTYGILSVTSAGATVSSTGTYGTLTVTKATGAYSFAPNNTAINARSANASETYTVTVTDGFQTTNATFTVSITAANDAPVMTTLTLNFLDTAAADSFTVATGTFSATDAESNTVSTWGITGASTVSSLLPWTTGSITFDRLFLGTYGSLYVRSSTGQYRFQPSNSAINALPTGTSESFPVTVADNLGASGPGSFTASITAVNDRPLVTVTAANLADVTNGLATSAYTLYHSSGGTGSTPGGEEVYQAFDDSSSTKYLNFSGAGSGVTIDLGTGNAYAVNGLGLTTANDSSERDPTSYEVYGSNNGTSFTLVNSGTMTAPTGRLTTYTDISFTNSTLYRWYRVVFPTLRVNGSAMQIAEIRLPAMSGNQLVYTEGSPAGVVLTGIDVSDADTASLTGATVSITGNRTTGDELSFTNDGSTMGSISGTYNASTGVLTLTGAGTPTEYQNAFRAVTFRNTTNNPTANAATRTVTWQANDGDATNNLSTTTTSTITVVETVPTISGIAVTSSAGSDNRYKIGDVIEVTATFTESMTVSGLPRLPVNGLTGKFFTFASGSGTNTLSFTYTVLESDSAAGGIGVTANSLALNGGTINDSVGAAGTITHSAIPVSTMHIVDGVLPTVTAFSTSKLNGSYMAGEQLTISATISESIQAGASVDVTLDTGTVLTLTTASAGTTLSGTYTIADGENSPDLTVSSFSITGVLDTAGNAMTSPAIPTGTNNIAGAKAIVIDTIAPTITQMAVSADGSYKAGQSITITATASEAIRAGNTITVTFDTAETLTLTAASAGATLSGTYTVSAGINSGDLTVTSFVVDAVADTAGNAMTSTTLPTGSNAIGSGTAVVVDTTAPTITSFSSTTSSGAYKATQTVNITATVSEPIGSGNTITVTLNSGASLTLSSPTDNTTWSGGGCGPYGRQTVTGSLSGGSVWGSGPYTSDSSFAKAAVHAGLIAVGQTAVIEPYAINYYPTFTGTTQNGITTSPWTTGWCGYSIRLATASSGSAHTTLTGTYTVAAGNTASSLDVSSFTIGSVLDGAGNAMTSTTVPSSSNIAASSSIAIDTAAPTIVSFSSTTADGAYKAGEAVNITATANEAVRSGNTITATLNTNRSVVLTAPSAGSTFTGTYTIQAGDTAADLTVSSFSIGSVLDTAGNALTSTTLPTGTDNIAGAQAIIVDTTRPTVSSFVSSQSSPTSSTTFTYTLTFSEPVTGIADADFVNTGTSTCTFDPGADTAATTRTVTASCTTKGTVIPRFDAIEAADAAGNTGPITANTSTTSVTINNAPTFTTPATAAYTDTIGVDTFSTTTGTLDAADADPGDTLTFTIISGTEGGTTVTRIGTYGTLTVTKSTGAFVFAPNASTINGRAVDATETHTLTVTDGIQTTSATFTISITATNDEPVMTDVTQTFADTAANDTQTVRFGIFSATDAESDTITSWSMAGATTVSDLLAWSSGSIVFDRKLVGTHGTLYIQNSTGKYRFEPDNTAMNGRVADGSEVLPITVTDSASVMGAGTFTVSMTATNDRPMVTVTAANIADVTNSPLSPTYALYHSSMGTGSTPGGEEVSRAFDNSSSSKYLNFSGAGSGVTIDLGTGNAYAVNGLGLTTANDAPERDPTSYEVYGSNNGTAFTLVSSGTMTPPSARYADYTDISFSNSTQYRWYRVVFPTIRSGDMMQIAEIRLPARSGNPLTYTEAAPAGVVLTGIDVTDADTATLTSATVSITTGLTTGDELAFTTDASTMGPISGAYDSTTGVLTLTGTATPAEYQNAFRAVTFRNTTNNPTAVSTTRTVTWRTDDNQGTDNLSTPSTSTITIVETVPWTTSTSFTSTSGTDNLYGIGDTLSVAVTFSELVDVTGTPLIPINGLSGRFLSYSSGSGTPTLVFTYNVVSGDAAPAGTGVTVNSLVLNGGTIRDSVGADATLNHAAIATSTAHAVDGVTATIPTFNSALATPTNLTTLIYTITFSESVTGVGPDDFTNSGTAEDCSFDPGTDTGSVRTLTVTSCGGGTVVPVFAANGAVDAAGNPAPLALSTSTSSINRRFVRTIAFAATSFTKTYGDNPFTVLASPSRGAGDGAVTYTVTAGTCSVGASSGEVTITGAGSCTVSATVAEGTNNQAATTATQVTVSIAKKALTITASSHAVIYGDAAPTVTPSYTPFVYNESTSDLTTPPTCSSPYTVTSTALVNVATNCTGATSPNYEISYTAGTITIAKQPTTVTFTAETLSQVFNGTNRPVAATTAPANKNLVFTYVGQGHNSTTAPVNVGTYTVTATVDEANFIGTATTTLVITKANQTALTFANPSSVTFGSQLQLVAVGGSGSGALSYSVKSGNCSVSATGMLTNTAAGSCVVSAARAMSPNYLATTSSDSTITVSKKDQSLAFTTTIPSNPVAGGTYSPKATATSELEVAISITSGENTVCSLANGVVTFIAAGSCTITGRQAGNANFNPADAATQTIAVGSMNQTISFTQPAEKRLGDPAFQLEASSSSGLSLSFSVTGTACSVSSTGLTTLLAPGTCDVTASSAADSKYGAAAAVTRTIVVRAGLPGVPHLMSASPSDSSIIVAYSTPPTDGGSPIVSYVVVAAPATGDPITRSDCSTVTLTCELVGLSNGMGYTVKVAAVTAAGVGDYSAETDPVTPFVAPEAVRDLTGVREEQSLLVAWEDPDSLGGGTLLRYDVSIREKDGSFGAPVRVSATNIRLATVGQRAWNHTFRNLSKAKVYEVKVVTVTTLSATSTPANTAQALVQRMNFAEAPRNLAIEATSETSAVATWATPLRDGGSPITSYSATSTNGTCAAAVATSLSCSMTNLTPGKAVTVTVKAVTAVGSSEISTATISLPSRPAAPTIESVTRKGTSATITWKAPASDGGRAVTSYRINGVSTLDSKDAPQCSSTSLTCTVEGLAMSAAYNFTAKAFNSLGEGATSSVYFAQAFSAVPAVWGSLSDTTERIAIGLPPAPGSVKVLSSSARRSSVIAMAPKTTIPITHAIITVAGAKGRVVLRVKVAVNQSNPQAAITIPYSSRSVSVAVQFANAFGVSAMTASGWKPATQVTRLTDAASNVQRGVTATKMVPIGSTIGTPVYFIGASSQLSSVAKAELARIAAVLKRDGGIVNVTGYARYSPDTSTSFMKKVSDQRALVVANYLATLGVQQWIRFQGVGAPTSRTGPDTDRRVVVSITPFD